MGPIHADLTASAALVADAEACLWQLRTEADHAEAARLVGADEAEAAARAAARPLLGVVGLILLRAEGASAEVAATLRAISASCAAEMARLRAREDPQLWREAAALWEAAGRPEEAAYARQRANRVPVVTEGSS